jgi:hypothetical protein
VAAEQLFIKATNRRAGASLLLGVTALISLATGCSSGDAPEDELATEQTLLFKDPSTSGPRLDVYDVQGHVAIAVGGPIGSEAMLGNFNGSQSLAEIYRVLHPDVATLPEDLVALDERVAPEVEALRLADRPPVDAPSPTFDKSWESFFATVCRTFTEGSATYTVQSCVWVPSGGQTVGLTPTDPGGAIDGGDRTYGWNHNAGTSRVRWTRASNNVVAATFTLPPYWWNWFTHYGNFRYRATIYGASASVDGERGLTWHSYSVVVK